MRLLLDLLLFAAAAADRQTLLAGVIERLKWLLDFDRCYLALLNADGKTYELWRLFEIGAEEPHVVESAVNLQHGLPGQVIQSGELRMLAEARAEDEGLATAVGETGVGGEHL